ncbi:MAG TPA: DNA recombination protein RmuC, partial [Gammaproteobacteria bacterium]|nr:DNA recombination protein RmuC [Gammaproteobacteria bacterium]
MNLQLIHYILIANLVSMAILLFLFIKQLTAQSANRQLETQIMQLTKQIQTTDQLARENLLIQFNHVQQALLEKLSHGRVEQTQQAGDLKEQLQQAFANYRARFDERQFEALKILQDTLQKGVQENRQQVKEALRDYAIDLGKRVDQLTQTTEAKLKEINQQVENRLSVGLEKTNETFHDVIKRLTLIDAAQQKISELSGSVMGLQEILNDKRSRGTFGEVQLSALIYNMIPETHFSFQHLLSNNKRPDCMLFLPEPTGNIAIDAKFPLENFRMLMDTSLSDTEKQLA